MLVLSPFPASRRRPTTELAAQRNDLVAGLAHVVFIAHASDGGKTEAFARKIVDSGKPLFTLDSPANANLLALGARSVTPALLRTHGDTVGCRTRAGRINPVIWLHSSRLSLSERIPPLRLRPRSPPAQEVVILTLPNPRLGRRCRVIRHGH